MANRERRSDGLRPTPISEPSLLDVDYVPSMDRIEGRQEEIASIQNVHNPVIFGKAPQNMLVSGPTGSGKTMSVRYALRQIVQDAGDQGIDIELSYLNCNSRPSLTDLSQAIVSDLGEADAIPDRRIGTRACLDRLAETVDGSCEVLVVILDEIEKVRTPDDAVKVVNSLREPNSTGVGITAISDDPRYLEAIPEPLETVFGDHVVSFPSYNRSVLESILDRRTDALVDGAVAHGVVSDIAGRASRDGGDAKLAIELLSHCARLADEEGDDELSESAVPTAETRARRDLIHRLLEPLPTHASVALQALAGRTDSTDVKSATLYRAYEDVCEELGETPRTKRHVRELLGELASRDIVRRTKEYGGSADGVYFRYSLDCNREPAALAARLVTGTD